MERLDAAAARRPARHVPASAVGAVGRYALHDRIASGGMASVHLGRLQGEGGFARIVAIKRLHPHLGDDPAFVTMFLDEARLVARIRHPNVVPTLDVIAADGEMLLVMEYIAGESLARLAYALGSRGERLPPRIVAAVMAGVLHGLHAAHEACDERGAALHIVHRDVSPQNILVGVDGVARLLDFGVAKARSRLSETRDGEIKGKLAYMAPEQLRQEEVDRRTDVYAAGVVLWEALTGKRFHGDATEASIVERILYGTVLPPTTHEPSLPAAVDALVMRALARDPAERFPTAREMADALEIALGVASMSEVSAWLQSVASTELSRRAALVTQVESAAEASAEARPSDQPAAAFNPTLADADDGRTERTFPRGARVGLGIAAVGVVAVAFAVVHFLAAAAPSAPASAVSDPSLAPAASVSLTPSASGSAMASTPAASSAVAATSITSGTPSSSARPRTPATVQARGRGAKAHPSSSLPPGLPTDRE